MAVRKAIAYITYILPALLLLAAIAGCDNTENDALLNPPLPDSASVRVVHLGGGDPISLRLAGLPVTDNLSPLFVSEYRSFLFVERVDVTLLRTTFSDTLRQQIVPRESRITYFTYSLPDTTVVITKTVTQVEEQELRDNNKARLVFINAAADSGYYIKQGCLSGDTLFNPTLFLNSSASIDVEKPELSLYLFKNGEGLPVSTARLQPTTGTVTYLIAAENNGTVQLYALPSPDASSSPRPLDIPAPETRTEAIVELFNALGDTPATGAIAGSGQIVAQDVPSLEISAQRTVDACSDPKGDSITISDAAGTATVPVRLSVGSATLLATFKDGNGKTNVLALDRSTGTAPAGSIRIRGVNLSPEAGGIAIAIGAGGPADVPDGLRPFGTLANGVATGYVELPVGTYPFILTRGSSSAFLDGGVQNMTEGYYSLFAVTTPTGTRVMVLRDDIPGAQPALLANTGRPVLLFNMMPDQLARFEAPTNAGTVIVDSLAYSYVATTLLPLDAATISAPGVGQTAIDITTGGYTIGATGTNGNRMLVAFKRPQTTPAAGKAAIRFLNAVPGSGDLDVHFGTVTEPTAATLAFGTPSQSTEYDVRKYSFLITRAGTEEVVAGIDGLELTAGYNYLLVVGPKGAASISDLEYGALWMQE